MATGIQLIWENDGMMIDSVVVSADEDELQTTVKKYLVEFLTNKTNSVLQKDWSAFGKNGDCIKVVHENRKVDFSNAPHCVSPVEF